MNNNLKLPIHYLEITDFDSDGNLKNPTIPTNKPVLIMVQGNFCGHCQHAKPYFQTFADKHKNIYCLTIQVDGNKPTEQGISSFVGKLDKSFTGAVPHYIYLNNGKKSKTGALTLELLEQFTN